MKVRTALPALEALIPTLMRNADVPGLSMVLIEEGTIMWERGFGLKSTELSDAVESGTIFEAASLSKPIFAYGVLKLCEKGILHLDTPLTKYLPTPYIDGGFHANDPLLKLVTIRQVLSHSAGFGNWGTNERGKINFTPGKKFFYAGEGYIYLQRVIEHVMDCSLDDYMVSNVLNPLGMQNSKFTWDTQFDERGLVAQGHGYRSEEVGRKWQEAFAAYSLYTTAHDFAIFLTEMMSSGEGDVFHLSEHTLTKMVKPQISINDELFWGLGWGIEKTMQGEYFWHWGDIGDFTCFTLASREKREGLVIMTNSEKGLRLCERIVREIFGGGHPCFTYFLD